jgi:hypothetical protein
MKQWSIHLIYISIIAFLSYNYWSSVQAFKAFEHLNAQLNLDYTALDEAALRNYKSIQKNYDGYQNYNNKRYYDKVMILTKETDSLLAFVKAYKADVVKKTFKNVIKTNNSFFSDAKINEIKYRLSQLHKISIDSIDDNRVKEKMLKQSNLPKLIDNNNFWQLFKTLPTSGVLAALSSIENQVKIDEIVYLDYYVVSTTYQGLIFDMYKTAIAPKKAALIEGETFETDIYLAAYSSNPGSNTIIKVNGEPLEIKEGVAHFKSKNQTIGTKTIKAEALVKNRLTGQTTTTVGSFEYQVLPKCSRDCQ